MTNFFSEEVERFSKGVLLRKKKPLLVCDENIHRIYSPLIRKLNFKTLVLPSGEKTKSREYKVDIEDYLITHGFDRNTELIAFGGGVISDLVGFVASTYMRGVTLSLIPTTITAFCDASVGGKNGINTEFGKNLLGTFYTPVDVCIEPEFLKSLDGKLYVEQSSEVFKIFLTFNKEYFLSERELLLEARELKDWVCKQDKFDHGLRQVLNFGHTFAHGLEKVTSYKVSHGKAVWLGLYFESLLSHHLNLLSEFEFEMIKTKLKKTGIDFKLPQISFEALFDAMKKDKKNNSERPHFVLLSKIGEVFIEDQRYAHPVSKEEIEKVFNLMQREGLCAVL